MSETENEIVKLILKQYDQWSYERYNESGNLLTLQRIVKLYQFDQFNSLKEFYSIIEKKEELLKRLELICNDYLFTEMRYFFLRFIVFIEELMLGDFHLQLEPYQIIMYPELNKKQTDKT